MVKSPCTKECCLEGDVCISCFRHRGEIKIWSETNDAVRNEILENAAVRKKTHERTNIRRGDYDPKQR